MSESDDYEQYEEDDGGLSDRDMLMWGGLILEGLCVFCAYALGWIFDFIPVQSLRWEWQAVGWGLVGTLGMLVVFGGVDQIPWQPFRRIKELLLQILGPGFSECHWTDLAGIALLAGIGEEFLFRGALHPLIGIYWSNLIFGMLHAITPTYVVLAFLLGMGLGWLQDASGNLLAPIIAHALFDFAGFLLVRREYLQMLEEETGESEPLSGMDSSTPADSSASTSESAESIVQETPMAALPPIETAGKNPPEEPPPATPAPPQSPGAETE